MSDPCVSSDEVEIVLLDSEEMDELDAELYGVDLAATAVQDELESDDDDDPGSLVDFVVPDSECDGSETFVPDESVVSEDIVSDESGDSA